MVWPSKRGAGDVVQVQIRLLDEIASSADAVLAFNPSRFRVSDARASARSIVRETIRTPLSSQTSRIASMWNAASTPAPKTASCLAPAPAMNLVATAEVAAVL